MPIFFFEELSKRGLARTAAAAYKDQFRHQLSNLFNKDPNIILMSSITDLLGQ